MATEYLFSNNATTTLAQSLSSTATVINVASGEGSLFPTPGQDQAFAVTLVDAATGLLNEICYCTSRSGDQLTVTRGEEGTNATSWLAGDTCANFITADVIENWLQESDLDGYATETWSKGEFLQLADTEEQTVTGPVTFSGATTVPSVTTFTGKDALNAETAEGRYVGSVIASGSTNVRITDIQEDSSGTLIATMSDGTTQNYIPSGQIVQANSAYSHASGGNGNTIYATCNVTLKRSATFLVTGCSNYAKVTSGQSQVELQYSSDGTTFTTFGSGDTTTASCIYATGILTLDAGDYVIRTVAENGNNTAIGWSAILSYIAVSE